MTALEDGPVAMFGSPKLWHLLHQAIAEGRDWYYGDHGYFRRGEYYRVTKNAFQFQGEGRPGRFDRLGVKMRPWRKNGDHIVLCPPDRTFAGLRRFDAEAWCRNVGREISNHTDRHILVRRRDAGYPLEKDLRGAWALVTYVSNAAVEAIMNGIPVFTTGTCAARGKSDLSQIEDPLLFDRYPWACGLADNQWTMEEIRSGQCWESIQ